ncbi:lytic transglycosylase [Methylomonas methanica]|uniref:Lytic transglycosylase n=1 Tax=Methylomonas methanica TaxID=421 RepID=A0A177MQ03_METMH|nr:lytic transglycosylase [Methylomonas methanica]
MLKPFPRLLLLATAFFGVSVHAAQFLEAPRVQAALEQGLAAERGKGVGRNPWLAIRLYCDAATMGSPEGFMRIGRVLAISPGLPRKPELANAYLAMAASLGSEDALRYYDARHGNAELQGDCDALTGTGYTESGEAAFNMAAYLSKQPIEQQRIARLIHKLAPKYQVDASFVLAIALAESNLNPVAVSPKNAQGVMQLIPATQERFGVRQPFDPERNIMGAMAYIRWLERRFAGDWRLVAAAYNAGEGAVDRHAGIPPYAETQQYVRRVMRFAGMAAKETMRFN